MRGVKLSVGGSVIGKAKTWAYPDGVRFGLYKIPTYELTVAGTNAKGKRVSKNFEVMRFGVQFKEGFASPKVVGLADKQTHVIKKWIPTYTVHSADSLEKGAWQVYDSFLIHDGPDDPSIEEYASIGCVEICNGPQGFDSFNDLIISLSGSSKTQRGEQLLEIGSSGHLSISYEQAKRPALERW
ncbi:hypothetical protein [Melittangium boletus]|uniref:hypothetical protein n=1 Tax=Melittangium boletus TaxID=83453 RepID=UPI003DA349A7